MLSRCCVCLKALNMCASVRVALMIRHQRSPRTGHKKACPTHQRHVVDGANESRAQPQSNNSTHSVGGHCTLVLHLVPLHHASKGQQREPSRQRQMGQLPVLITILIICWQSRLQSVSSRTLAGAQCLCTEVLTLVCRSFSSFSLSISAPVLVLVESEVSARTTHLGCKAGNTQQGQFQINDTLDGSISI